VRVVSDKNAKTVLSRDLEGKLTALLAEVGHDLELLKVGSDDVVRCAGVFSTCRSATASS
jgi:hypothetical protein